MPNRSIARISLFGVLFIVLCGTPLHFFNDWINVPFVAWFGPVNESTWEHFKLAFWPALIWTIFEWRLLPEFRSALWTAKLVAVTTTFLAVIVLFYGYTAVLGHNVLTLDVATFVIAVAIGQWLCSIAWRRGVYWSLAPWALVGIAACFVYFSYAPPLGFLFQVP